MTDKQEALAEALERARRWNETATDEEKAAMWKLQRESWARDGNGRVDGFGTTYIHTPSAQDAMREALEKAANAWDAFGVARSAMNASIPAVNSTPAERALYDERYKADHEAQREHWRAAVDLAQSARSILAALSAPNVAGDRDCPRCGGDCSAANPPPIFCPMQTALSTPQPESVDDVRAALAEAIEALRVARSWFDFYARNHRVAGKLDKAARNQQLADMTARVVAKHGEGR